MIRGILTATTASLATLLLCGALAAVPGVQADPAPATTPAATPEAALAQLVARTGATYAGDCATTQSPADLGKVCSRFIAAQGSMRAHWLGRTFAEFTTWAFVRQGPDGWEVIGTAPLNPQAGADAVPWPSD